MEAEPSSTNALRAARRALRLVGALILAGALISCGRAQRTAPPPADDFTVTLATEPNPPIVGPSLVVLKLQDPTGDLIANARVSLEANMSHAGMTPLTGQAGAGQDGFYRVPIEWTMAGDWYLDVAFSLPDGQTAARRFPINIH